MASHRRRSRRGKRSRRPPGESRCPKNALDKGALQESPRLQGWPRSHRLEAERLHLPFRSLARLAQDEESGVLGGEAGSGGGLGALTAPAGTFSAASDKTSTLRSPAFASSMILLAMISSLRSRGHLMAARAISNATPRRRTVSGSKVCPANKGLMGMRVHSKQTESKLANFTLTL